jgi:aspartate aminotransferase-like enzyme
MNVGSHKKLFIPGPVEVHPQILAAMAKPMIGHRTKEYKELHARTREKLRTLLQTNARIFLLAASAFGPMEGVIRNVVGDNERCLNIANGAFSKKWHDVTVKCGKTANVIEFNWGYPIDPDELDKALATGKFDVVTMIHNETSCGVMSDLWAIAEVLRKYPDVISVVDTVSSMSALNIPIDTLGIDVCIFGVQKAFGLPPGLSVVTVSEKAMKQAAEVEGRGYYFDFLAYAKADDDDSTPSTPSIPHINALDVQLSRFEKEGYSTRFERHTTLMEMTHAWGCKRGFELFPSGGAYSRTVSCFNNTVGVDLALVKKKLGEYGYAFDDGYGDIKGKTFRIGHMGDMTQQDLGCFLYMVDRAMGFEP